LSTTNSGNPTVSDVLFILDPGNTILVTVLESTGTAPVAFETVWYEL
jgi:hypothetical protein